METLRASPNFVWDTQKSLGQGATSMVYLGRSKRTFEKVAVKVFIPESFGRPVAIQMREFEVMKKLNHKNIVQLIAVEEEVQKLNKVIVMEYCPHGSLISMMEEFPNAFGIPEEEVLLVLQHVANGMKHLRSNAVVHRDVKPGNILRSIDPDGRSVYKLTDFGAARELEDEESFLSLYGTEEYLHPHMYEKAVLRRDNAKLFNASVDLWSIGVTYFHMATGMLPFRPYGGRRNRELMHKIVSQKERGVIMGVQYDQYAPIEWSRKLPNTCLLSKGLKQLLTPLLAGLLEINPDYIWTFEKYFDMVDSICNKVVIHGFCPMMASSLQFYLDKNDNLTSLHENITKQTDIPAKQQLLLFDNKPLEMTIDTLLTVKNYPENITRHNPIFVLDECEQFKPYPEPEYIAPFPPISESGQLMNLEADYRCVKQCIKIGCAVKTATQNIVRQNKLLHSSVKQYSNHLYQEIEVQNSTMKYVSQCCQTTKISWENFLKTVRLQLQSLGILDMLHPVQSLRELILFLQQFQTQVEADVSSKSIQVQELLSRVKNQSEKLKTTHLDAKQLTMEWNFQDGCLADDRCTEVVGELVDKVEDSYEIIKGNRTKRSLNYNNEQIHKYEKSQIQAFTESIKGRLTTHCCPRAVQVYIAYKVWYKKAVLSRGECMQNKTDIDSLIQLQTCFSHSFIECVGNYISIVEEKLPVIKEVYLKLEQQRNMTIGTSGLMASKSMKKDDSLLRRQVAGDILEGLKSSRSSVEEMVHLVRENNAIIERFDSLSMTPENWEDP